MVLVDTQELREEASSWNQLAGDVSEIQRAIEGQLWLAPSAFFIGNFSEIVHYPAYEDFRSRLIGRLGGAAVEFELIGFVLDKLADEYDESDELSRDEIERVYTVTDEDVARVTEEEASRPDSGQDAGGLLLPN